MPDRRGLGLIGYLLGALTVTVMLIAGVVVNMSIAGDADASAPEMAVGSGGY